MTSPGSPSVGSGMDLVAGHHQLRALLAPSRELPEAPAWGFQKCCLKQLLKQLCLSRPLHRHGRGYTAGLSGEGILQP